MKKISMIAAIALFGASAAVTAGEESTANWGAGGTGEPFWMTQCGLEHFPGPSVDTPNPCTDDAGQHYQTSDKGVVPMRLQSAATGSSPKAPETDKPDTGK